VRRSEAHTKHVPSARLTSVVCVTLLMVTVTVRLLRVPAAPAAAGDAPTTGEHTKKRKSRIPVSNVTRRDKEGEATTTRRTTKLRTSQTARHNDEEGEDYILTRTNKN